MYKTLPHASAGLKAYDHQTVENKDPAIADDARYLLLRKYLNPECPVLKNLKHVVDAKKIIVNLIKYQ